jgi:UDP-glucose 4-epimerase
MRTLVTGGAGFVGSHLVDRLLDDGHDVTVLDDFSTGKIENLIRSKGSRNFKLIKGDVADGEVALKALTDIDVVFHLAAIVSVQKSIAEPKLTNHTNVEGTRNLLECAEKLSLKKFVFASSAAVYGDCQILPIPEDAPPSPISPYGKSKLQAELACLNASKRSGLDVSILRHFNIYGPRSVKEQYSGVIDKFADRLTAFESPIIYGDGKQIRDFVYVNDVTSAIISAGLSRSTRSKIFNVSSGERISIEDLAILESKLLLGDNIIIPLDYRPAQPNDIRFSYADISRIRKELSFEPKFSLKEGLRNYLAWMYPTFPIRGRGKS